MKGEKIFTFFGRIIFCSSLGEESWCWGRLLLYSFFSPEPSKYHAFTSSKPYTRGMMGGDVSAFIRASDSYRDRIQSRASAKADVFLYVFL
jgi:hypothetical protein